MSNLQQEPPQVFQDNPQIAGPDPQKRQPPEGWSRAIKALKEKLIDTSKRNRLINTPIGKDRGKHLDIIEERSDEIFKLLVHKNKKMHFAFKDGDGDLEIRENIFVPDPDPPSAKHLDLKLQTRLRKDELHKRLLQLYRDSNSAVEEQGSNPLFLALGFVRWFEDTSSRLERYAPLILLPVELMREGVRDNFKLSVRDIDLEVNHSFDAFLKSDFDLRLPAWPKGEDWLPSEYFRQVNHLISTRENWNVCADVIQLGFYSSGKFLMSKDLDNAEPTELMEHLLCGGFGGVSSLFDPTENLDERYTNPQDLGHIMEADASQTRVIAAAREGQNMVVQGPPGTGKSQTIANIIAVAVRDNQKVLFVAEKRAALDVVYDRLESCGLGPLCLEMHSTKAQKKTVYDELGKTLNLGPPRIDDRSEYDRLRAVRDELNELSDQIHAVDEVNGETPYNIMGKLSKLMADRDLPRPDYHVKEIATWSREKADNVREDIQKLVDLMKEYGPEGTHDWRGANRKITPMERDRLNDQVKKLQDRLNGLKTCLDQACKALSISDEGGLAFAEKIHRLIESMGSRPRGVDSLMRVEGVVEYSGKLRKLLESIQQEQAVRARLEESVLQNAFSRDWSIEHREIAKHKSSLFRWFRGSYLAAIKQVKAVAKNPKQSNSDRLKVLNMLISHRAQMQEIGEQRALGETVVGPLWRGWKTDVSEVIDSIQWIDEQIRMLGSPGALTKQVNQWPEDVDPVEMGKQLCECIREFEAVWNEVVSTCDLDVQRAFDEKSIHSVPLCTITHRMSRWAKNPDGQDTWIQLHDVANKVSTSGLDEIRDRLASGQLAPEYACDTYDYIRTEAVYTRFNKMNPDLGKINGRDRTVLVEQFRDLDAAPLKLSSQEVMAMHYESIPEGTRGEMGLLRGEVQKKTRHMPLRRLLKEVGDAVQAIKPVFLMSPLSVAQYLDPDGLKFDLVLIDEASQVRPADAIGSIMRAKRAIVVGDQKQLPPTSFFEKLVSIEEESEGQALEDVIAEQVKDMESILSLCDARGMPGCMLKWHYRSQHESLIAVSNQEFYNNKLVCPPSPAITNTKLGLTFQYVDGIYRRGRGKSDNLDEAKTVMNAVLEHVRTRPGESLGIVAMSQSQQTTIQNEAEKMRAEYPELNSFCSESKENPFFIKNLETVQGDERDVIFISVGYGKTEDGRLSQNFGPVSNEGGERRLNVLFTRAKKRCRVFASIRHTDIQHEKARHRGPYMLKTFLKYAETGEMDVPILTGRPPDSPFEEAVGDAIRGYGYDIDYQVGSDGFLIDLAVRDPENEGGYILAIECDGARYHSSYWARERDRMRQTLLEAKGWVFHRIWSTDWFNNPEDETLRAINAIRQAGTKTSKNRSPIQRPFPIARGEPSTISREAVEFYKEFNPENGDTYASGTYGDIHRAGEDEVAGLITEIVEIEGPIHQDIIVRKTRIMWGHEQAGQRVKEVIFGAIDTAEKQGKVIRCDLDQNFLKTPSTKVCVRNRSRLNESQLRKPEMISPQEYRKAILRAVKRCLAISQEDCAVDAARMFGFKSTSTTFKKQAIEQIPPLIRDGYLTVRTDGTMCIPYDQPNTD